MKLMNLAFIFAALAILFFGTIGTLSAAEGSSWFDMTNCAMCAPMMAEKGLMEHMKWENHKVATGMMSVTIVDPAFAAAYGRAGQKMNELGMKLAKGEKMPLCGHCQSIGDLMGAGAKMDNFATGAGHVMAVTGTDPALITKIQAHCDRTVAEMAKMEKKEEHQHKH